MFVRQFVDCAELSIQQTDLSEVFLVAQILSALMLFVTLEIELLNSQWVWLENNNRCIWQAEQNLKPTNITNLLLLINWQISSKTESKDNTQFINCLDYTELPVADKSIVSWLKSFKVRMLLWMNTTIRTTNISSLWHTCQLIGAYISALCGISISSLWHIYQIIVAYISAHCGIYISSLWHIYQLIVAYISAHCGIYISSCGISISSLWHIYQIIVA